MRRIASDLERHRRQWALVGGFAVSARAEPRFTRDIDVAVMVDDDPDGERLVRSLLASRYRPLASVEQDETGRLPTVRLGSPLGDGDVIVDLLFASSGIESEVTQAAELTEVVPGLSLPIATTGAPHRPQADLPRRPDSASRSGGSACTKGSSHACGPGCCS